MFGFKGKLKWSIFINYYARSHILLTSGTHSSLLLLPHLRLKIGHHLTQITDQPLPTLSTPTSPLSAPPFSTLTILHYRLHLFLTPHPTRYGTSSATILDLFLATLDVPITSSSVLQHSFSNHLPICLQIKCAVPSPPPSLVTHRSSRHFSKSSFEDDLSCVPWSIIDVFDDPDDKVEAFDFLFTDVLDCHAPLKTIRVRKNSSPWITKTIQTEMDRRDRLFRFYHRHPSTGAWDIFEAQRNRVVWLQRKAKNGVFSSTTMQEVTSFSHLEHTQACYCFLTSA